MRGAPGVPVWQRNYYEHIVRDDDALNRIRQYIRHNPAEWQTDDHFDIAVMVKTIDPLIGVI
jgi:putative transposase